MQNSPIIADNTHALAWTDLWRRGVLHSCASGIEGNYDGAIADFWTTRFQTLNDRDCVVDLATGNGALALLAAHHAEARGITLDIHGIDLADIAPARDTAGNERLLSSIHFHPRTAIHDLPFADGSIPLLVSQFGFEYAGDRASAEEMIRVLANDGRIALILHSKDSLVAQTAPLQLAGIDYLLGQSLIGDTARMAGLLATHRSPDRRRALIGSAAAEPIRLAFNHSVNALMDRLDAEPDTHVLKQATQQIATILKLADQGRLEDIQRATLGWQDALLAEQARLEQLGRALLSAEQLAQIAQWFRDTGLQVETSAIHRSANSPMGWSLIADHG
ncbi:MAG: class I SAM-dependent methyltransferase [Pseudomonadota bacterium]|nr:class I SAM-dependent methyltransferase [Pseudomonadota bacterium]